MMKLKLRKYGKTIVAPLIVIILTILLFPRNAVWYQFGEPMDEFDWKRTKSRDISYEKTLSSEETRKLRAILKDTELYDTRKFACDRVGGVFNGELKVNGRIYGVDLSSGLILGEKEIGWLSEEHISWLKQACLKPAVPAVSDVQ